MLNLQFDEILKAINGNVLIDSGFYSFEDVSTDSRKISIGSIFIALKGYKFNGNDFIENASKQGASLCIIDEIKYQKENLHSNTSIILVKDTRKALIDLAKYYRSKLDVKIIGVTGSTGKTSTKDLIAAALGNKFKTFKTRGNFNNDIGLPLMMFCIDDSYDAAVLEMGMSNLGEIHTLTDIARPDIAIITNIGISHIENLKTRENILKAKLEITDFFTKENTLIVNSDNDLLIDINSYVNLNSPKYNLIKTGIDNKSDYFAKDIIYKEESVEFTCLSENEDIGKIIIPVPGKHTVLNSLLAIACAKLLKVQNEDIIMGLQNLETTSMRLQIFKYEKYTIINDCYNASPDSMKAAIDVLNNIKGNKKIAILGTMNELGDKTYEYHYQVGKYAKDNEVDYLFVAGNLKEAYCRGFGDTDKCYSFDNYDDLINSVLSIIGNKDVVLIKASRSLKFEYIAEKLKA